MSDLHVLFLSARTSMVSNYKTTDGRLILSFSPRYDKAAIVSMTSVAAIILPSRSLPKISSLSTYPTPKKSDGQDTTTHDSQMGGSAKSGRRCILK
jgi:hypothetical protein